MRAFNVHRSPHHVNTLTLTGEFHPQFWICLTCTFNVCSYCSLHQILSEQNQINLLNSYPVSLNGTQCHSNCRWNRDSRVKLRFKEKVTLRITSLCIKYKPKLHIMGWLRCEGVWDSRKWSSLLVGELSYHKRSELADSAGIQAFSNGRIGHGSSLCHFLPTYPLFD
jgi:hypothetical protein